MMYKLIAFLINDIKPSRYPCYSTVQIQSFQDKGRKGKRFDVNVKRAKVQISSYTHLLLTPQIFTSDFVGVQKSIGYW